MFIKKMETEQDRDNVIKYLSGLGLKYAWMVKVKKFVNKRTIPQNSLYHMWKSVIAEDLGYRSRDMHDVLRERFLPAKRVKVLDKEYTILTSTTDLDTKQFTDFLDAIYQEFTPEGHVLPLPGERGLEELYEKYKDTF